jgi:C1A family cysteine protease
MGTLLRFHCFVKLPKSPGSCWAFAAAAVLEMSYVQNVGGISSNTIHFSEEEFVQCCNSARGCSTSQGCNGGNSDEVGDGTDHERFR